MTFAPEPLCTGDPPPRVPGTGRIPFARRGEDFDWLTDHALRVAAGNPGNVTTSSLAMVGSEELPDCRLPQAVRQNVKELVRQAAESLSVDGLMFMAGAAEDAARRKRDQENWA